MENRKLRSIGSYQTADQKRYHCQFVLCAEKALVVGPFANSDRGGAMPFSWVKAKSEPEAQGQSGDYWVKAILCDIIKSEQTSQVPHRK